MSEERLAGIENKLEILIEGMTGVETRLGGVETRLSKLEVNQDEMKDEIKLIAEGHAATQDLIRRETKALLVHFDERIGLVENVVRQHSALMAVRSRAARPARRK